jgi:hypothetical protein
VRQYDARRRRGRAASPPVLERRERRQFRELLGGFPSTPLKRGSSADSLPGYRIEKVIYQAAPATCDREFVSAGGKGACRACSSLRA